MNTLFSIVLYMLKAVRVLHPHCMSKHFWGVKMDILTSRQVCGREKRRRWTWEWESWINESEDSVLQSTAWWEKPWLAARKTACQKKKSWQEGKITGWDGGAYKRGNSLKWRTLSYEHRDRLHSDRWLTREYSLMYSAYPLNAVINYITCSV